MDECGFDLSTTCRTPQVAPYSVPINSQAALSSSVHIGVITAISTQDTPAPPFLTYPGKYLMTDWTQA